MSFQCNCVRNRWTDTGSKCHGPVRTMHEQHPQGGRQFVTSYADNNNREAKHRATNFCTLVPNILSITVAIFIPNDNVHQFTRNEHKAPDISKAHTSVQDCCSSLFNLLHIILLVLRIYRLLLDFWTICGTDTTSSSSNNNNNNNNNKLQKTAISGTAHILRKVLT